MYVYWRIQQDLSCLGEVIHFHDPAFINKMRKWIRKNHGSLAMMEDVYPRPDLVPDPAKPTTRN